MENEKIAAEDMRKRALEWVRQTTKRMGKEEGAETEPQPKRKSWKGTGEAVEYLKERASIEIQMREREMELRRKEQESTAQREKERNEQDQLLSTMLKQQQQQQQMMMMMMNQQSQVLVSLMEKIFPK